MEDKLLELLKELYNALESEHLDLGIDMLEEHIKEYPEFKHILEKIHLERGGKF